MRRNEYAAESNKEARGHWAYQPVSRPAIPAASRETLLRRVTFDLIGLPPTTDELRAFLADNSPDAFTKVVDRLLASPHFGERWGRHWLDIARYSDTAGQAKAIVESYRYDGAPA